MFSLGERRVAAERGFASHMGSKFPIDCHRMARDNLALGLRRYTIAGKAWTLTSFGIAAHPFFEKSLIAACFSLSVSCDKMRLHARLLSRRSIQSLCNKMTIIYKTAPVKTVRSNRGAKILSISWQAGLENMCSRYVCQATLLSFLF